MHVKLENTIWRDFNYCTVNVVHRDNALPFVVSLARFLCASETLFRKR